MTWPGERYGDAAKPPVVMLHGFLGRGSDWQPIAETLAEDHYVICPDLPGHGAHDVPEHLHFDSVVASLMDSLDTEIDGACSVVGYSLGGRVALYAAIKYPERIARLVLESASPGLEREDVRASRVKHDDRLARLLEAAEGDSAQYRAWLEDWYDNPMWHTMREHAGLVERQVTSRMDGSPARLAQVLRALSVGRQPHLWKVLDRLVPPTLLITGELDHKFDDIAEGMAMRNPRIARQVLSGCGHNVHAENAGDYTTVLRSFLRE